MDSHACIMAFMPRGKASPTTTDPSMRILVVHGKDDFLRLERVKRFIEQLEEEHGQVEIFTFDGGEASRAEILDELRSFGLLQQHKVVIIENAESFMAVEENRRAMEQYAEAALDQATLVLRAMTWRPGKFDKKLDGVGAVIKCDVPSNSEAMRWTIARASKRHEAQLDQDAAGLLVERIGPDLAKLDNEIAKLSSMSASRNESGQFIITRDQVVEMVGLSRQEQAWELQSILLRADPAASLSKLHELREISRVPDVLLIWSITDVLRKLHDAARMRAAGVSDQVVAKTLKLWGPARDAVLQVSRRHPPGRLGSLLSQAVQVDEASKTGRTANPVRSIETLTVTVADSLR